MKVTIDRFEGEFAVVELPDRSMVNMPKVLLPENSNEGNVIEIKIDEAATKREKDSIRKLMDEVWE